MIFFRSKKILTKNCTAKYKIKFHHVNANTNTGQRTARPYANYVPGKEEKKFRYATGN